MKGEKSMIEAVQNVSEIISITKDEYDDLKTKSIDWDNMHIIMSRCEKDVAYEVIKTILGLWDDEKEINIIEF